MKRLVTILSSLLLIVAQTFAVALPVGSSVSAAGPGCCCDECQCCVSSPDQSSQAPLESTSPVAAQSQFVLAPVGIALYALEVPANETFPPSANAEFRAAPAPLFQRNCVFLI